MIKALVLTPLSAVKADISPVRGDKISAFFLVSERLSNKLTTRQISKNAKL